MKLIEDCGLEEFILIRVYKEFERLVPAKSERNSAK